MRGVYLTMFKKRNLMISFIKLKLIKNKKLLLLCFVLVIVFLIYFCSLQSNSATNYVFITKWGSKGTGDGKFIKPADITVSRKGYVYVADYGNGSIQKFDSTGKFITRWNCEKIDDYKYCRIELIDKHRFVGGRYIIRSIDDTTERLIWNKVKIALDSKENVYVIDNTSEIKKFDSNGKFIKKIFHKYRDKFSSIAIDSFDHIFTVTDIYLKVFTSNGRLLSERVYFRHEAKDLAVDEWGYCYIAYYRYGSTGIDAGDVFRGSPCYSYFAIVNNGIWGGLNWPPISEYGISLGKEFSKDGTIVDPEGPESHKLSFYWCVPPIPVDIAIDSKRGDVFAVHPGDNCVMKFNPSKTKSAQFIVTDNILYNSRRDIASTLSLENRTFSRDELIRELKKLSFDEKDIRFILKHATRVVTQWGSKGTGDGQFYCPRCIAVDSEGNVYVADTGNHRIQKFAPKD